jgi:hypothetical protein
MMRGFWVEKGLGSELRQQTAAAPDVTLAGLAREQVIQVMCLLLAQAGGDDFCPRHCCVSHRSVWPADPMQYAVSLLTDKPCVTKSCCCVAKLLVRCLPAMIDATSVCLRGCKLQQGVQTAIPQLTASRPAV